MIKHDKLVRDGIVAHIESKGERAEWRTLMPKEFGPRLFDKLGEEFDEFLLALSTEPQKASEEAGDFLEVWEALRDWYCLPQRLADAALEFPYGQSLRVALERESLPANDNGNPLWGVLTQLYVFFAEMAQQNGLTLGHVRAAKEEKRRRVGGFEKRILLISTG